MTVEAGDLSCGCVCAVGGILSQIRGESLVFGETEGELKRERELGYASENGVSILGIFSVLPRQNAAR